MVMQRAVARGLSSTDQKGHVMDCAKEKVAGNAPIEDALQMFVAGAENCGGDH